MIAAAAMAVHSPTDTIISMFSKSYQYSGKINKSLLIPSNSVIDKQLSENSLKIMYILPFGTCHLWRSWSFIQSGSIEDVNDILELSSVGKVVGSAVSFPFCN